MDGDARMLDVVDAVAELLAAETGVAVETDFAPDVTDPDGAFEIDGRRVYLFPAGYGQVEQSNRLADLSEYRVACVVVERYAGDGPPPRAWVRERINWAAGRVYALLGDKARVLSAGGGELWPESATVETVYDLDMLRHHKLFWSELEFAFREVA